MSSFGMFGNSAMGQSRFGPRGEQAPGAVQQQGAPAPGPQMQAMATQGQPPQGQGADLMTAYMANQAAQRQLPAQPQMNQQPQMMQRQAIPMQPQMQPQMPQQMQPQMVQRPMGRPMMQQFQRSVPGSLASAYKSQSPFGYSGFVGRGRR
jgi:hypothetical protein